MDESVSNETAAGTAPVLISDRSACTGLSDRKSGDDAGSVSADRQCHGDGVQPEDQSRSDHGAGAGRSRPHLARNGEKGIGASVVFSAIAALRALHPEQVHGVAARARAIIGMLLLRGPQKRCTSCIHGPNGWRNSPVLTTCVTRWIAWPNAIRRWRFGFRARLVSARSATHASAVRAAIGRTPGEHSGAIGSRYDLERWRHGRTRAATRDTG